MNKIILASLMLSGCASHSQITPPEPVIITKTVSIAVPVACPALAKLGPEPKYADTDAALRDAPDIFEQVRILAKGRLQRMIRASVYIAARVACTF